MVIVDVLDMGRGLTEDSVDVSLEAAQHRIGVTFPGKVHQPVSDQAGKPSGIAAPGGQLLVGQAGRPVDHPGKRPAQADPVLIDTGA
jgi:hypothetical protein